MCIRDRTQGFAILIAQHFGAKEYRLLRKSVAMSIVLAAAIAVVMSVLLQILAEPVLRLLNTDPAVLDEALLYLRISYGGFAVVMAYNLLASVLRSLGDGTTPLVAMGVACACLLYTSKAAGYNIRAGNHMAVAGIDGGHHHDQSVLAQMLPVPKHNAANVSHA